jgi:hypothetical protein
MFLKRITKTRRSLLAPQTIHRSFIICAVNLSRAHPRDAVGVFSVACSGSRAISLWPRNIYLV